MMTEARIGQPNTFDRTDIQQEVPAKIVERLTQNAAKNPGDSNSRLLVSLAIAATEKMNSEVFGEQTQPFTNTMQLAKDWSTEEKDTDFKKMYEYWQELGKEAF